MFVTAPCCFLFRMEEATTQAGAACSEGPMAPRLLTSSSCPFRRSFNARTAGRLRHVLGPVRPLVE